MQKQINGHHVLHIDANTGEVICETKNCTFIGDTESSPDEQKQQEYAQTHIINFNEGVDFVKLFKGVNTLRKALTPSEFSVAISLADFVCYDDCVLRSGGHRNGRILSIKDLSELMSIEYSNLCKTIKTLIKKGVIGIHQTGDKNDSSQIHKTITVNPYIFCRGKDISHTATTLFSESHWSSEE